MGTRAHDSTSAEKPSFEDAAHEGHTGATGMKMFARRYVYWH